MSIAPMRIALLVASLVPFAAGAKEPVDPADVPKQLGELGRIMSRPLPVYPGSQLSLDEPDRHFCCEFTTRDGIDKVTAFYQRAAGATVVDQPGLMKRFPDMNREVADVTGMAREVAAGKPGPGVTLRYMIFAEVSDGSRRAGDVVAVACSGGTCRYGFLAERLLPQDRHFADEWEQRFGRGGAGRGGDGRGAAQSGFRAALPSMDLSGFTREPIEAQGGDVPSASVRWAREEAFYQVAIYDLSRQREAVDQFLAVDPGSGLRKVKVNGAWPGVEATRPPENGVSSGERRFLVHGRYGVEVTWEAPGAPASTVDRLCGALDVKSLPR